MAHERILLVRLSALGDIVLATPVARRLRCLYPGGHITWLADQPYTEILAGAPDVDRVVGYDYLGRHRGLSGATRLADEIGKVELFVDLQHKMRTLLLAASLRPRRRLVLAKRRGWQVARAIVGRDAILRAPHQVERYLALLGPVAGQESREPRLTAPPSARDEARRTHGGASTPLAGLVVGARHPTKCWPADHLVDLCGRFRSRGIGVVLLGGPEQVQLATWVSQQEHAGQPQIFCEKSLSALSGVLSLCRLVVGPDSGPLHLAAALGVPTVALFGPTSPERWAPRGSVGRVVRLDLPCSPCSNHGSSHCPPGHHACMVQLEPALVWQAIEELMTATGARGSHE